MIKHRTHIPLILAMSLGIGLIPDLFHALTYSRSTSLALVLLCGTLIGGLLACLVIFWIQRCQSNGVLRLGVGVILVLLSYLVVMYVISWSQFVSDRAAFCTTMRADDAIDCRYKWLVLQSMADFVLWGSIYTWGIRLENRSGQRLIYNFRLQRG
jgi:hypothetical protein